MNKRNSYSPAFIPQRNFSANKKKGLPLKWKEMSVAAQKRNTQRCQIPGKPSRTPAFNRFRAVLDGNRGDKYYDPARMAETRTWKWKLTPQRTVLSVNGLCTKGNAHKNNKHNIFLVFNGFMVPWRYLTPCSTVLKMHAGFPSRRRR